MATAKVMEIEGIGPAHAEKLKKVNIRSVSAILKKGATKQGRKEMAEKTGIDEGIILKWVNMADLFRVKGIGSEYAELLEKAGVDTVKELRNRVPENLHAKMAEINSQGRPLVRLLPGVKRVQKWIETAKKLEPVVTY